MRKLLLGDLAPPGRRQRGDLLLAAASFVRSSDEARLRGPMPVHPRPSFHPRLSSRYAMRVAECRCGSCSASRSKRSCTGLSCSSRAGHEQAKRSLPRFLTKLASCFPGAPRSGGAARRIGRRVHPAHSGIMGSGAARVLVGRPRLRRCPRRRQNAAAASRCSRRGGLESDSRGCPRLGTLPNARPPSDND